MNIQKIVLSSLSVITNISTVMAETQEKPNIVYILCDDLGYGDIQCLNPERGKIPTPNVDKLANQGIIFTDSHSGSSVCTPTRYGILTGRHSWRTHLQSGVLGGVGKNHNPLIPKDRMTVASFLKGAGYATACIGKWHLGFNFTNSEGKHIKPKKVKWSAGVPIGTIVPNGPTTRGFDEYLGFHHAGSMKSVIKNGKVIDEMPTIKMLQFIGKESIDYIEKQSKHDSPFFLYIPLNSPHGPIVPSKQWQGKSGVGKYGDFVMETDDIVGKILKAIKDNGEADNTVVIFTSDNGCSYPCANGKQLEEKYGHYSSANLRGSKADIWDGGHRVPFIVRWPGKIKAGTSSPELICHTDFMATCADIIGEKLPDNVAEDSVSILPALLNKNESPIHEAIIHHSISGRFSIRKGKWKLELCNDSGGWTAFNDTTKKQRPAKQLYDMVNDISETNNLIAEYPEVAKELELLLKRYVKNGRMTPGPRLKNDVPINIYKKNK